MFAINYFILLVPFLWFIEVVCVSNLSLKWRWIYQRRRKMSLTRVVGVLRKRICQAHCLWHRHRYISVCVEHPVRPYPIVVCWVGPHRGSPNPWSLTCWRLLRPLFRNEYWRLFHSSVRKRNFLNLFVFSQFQYYFFKNRFFSVIFGCFA